jgi:hypothetical protein
VLEQDNEAYHPIVNFSLLSRSSVFNKKKIDFYKESYKLSLKIDFSNVADFARQVGEIYKDGCFEIENIDSLYDMLRLRKCEEFERPTSKKVEFVKKIKGGIDMIYPYACVGIFTHENVSLYEMYNELIESDEGVELFKKINDLSVNVLDEQKGRFLESEIKQITSLDYTQKKAIKLSFNNNLIIQGPPGTGKSQTIVNIIANAVFNQKKVLFVTEKYVAAEVVEKRLLKLNKFSLPIFDIHNAEGKARFYEKIKDQRDFLQYFARTEKKYFNHGIDDKIEKIFIKLKAYNDFKCAQSTQRFLSVVKLHNKFPKYEQ